MKSRDLLIIAILTLITVIAWIFFEAYHTYKTSTIPQELKIQLEPLNFNLPVEEINKLKKRSDFSEFTSPTLLVTPTAEPTIFLTPTLEPSLTPPQEASPTVTTR